MSGTVSLWASVVAVAGTLLGGLLAGVVQARTARVARRETREADRRSEALGAVTALLSALADHRGAMRDREDLRLSGADEDALRDARAVVRVTRAAITAPLSTVAILLPDLAKWADAAVQATYALRKAPDHTVLEHLRLVSVGLERVLRQAASRALAAERPRSRRARRGPALADEGLPVRLDHLAVMVADLVSERSALPQEQLDAERDAAVDAMNELLRQRATRADQAGDHRG
ncbi:hypothetical protein [Actinophytocola sediminis]